MPVLVAPMSAMLMAHKEGEPATARATVAANTSMVPPACFAVLHLDPTMPSAAACALGKAHTFHHDQTGHGLCAVVV